MKHRETKTRSVIKSFVWRIIAFLNSWLILTLTFTNSSFYNALVMNITGMIIFYTYERIWNTIEHGKYTL